MNSTLPKSTGTYHDTGVKRALPRNRDRAVVLGGSMATIAEPVRRPINKDRIFFPSMCVLILITVWLGFSKTYYAAGMVRAHLPSPIVHIHAIIFSLWLVMLAVQTGLVSAKNVHLHRKLGLWGFGLAALMVVVGMMAGTEALRRGASPPGSGLDPRVFYFVPVSSMLLFATFIGWAYTKRRRPAEHKRLIIFATILLVDAAIGRFPQTIAPMGPTTLNLISIGLMVPILAYDLATLKNLNRFTIVSFLVIVIWLFIRIPLGMTSPWLQFATLMRR